jgi:hypothetical protein
MKVVVRPRGNPLRMVLTAWTVVLLVLAAGCANQYQITLTNGGTILSRTRPKPDGHGYYIYQDADGREQRVNELRVREIEAK